VTIELVVSPLLSQMSKTMILFIYGSDTYRSRKKLNEIIDYYKKFTENGFVKAAQGITTIEEVLRVIIE